MQKHHEKAVRRIPSKAENELGKPNGCTTLILARNHCDHRRVFVMASSFLQEALRTLPQVEELLRTSYLQNLADALPRALLVDAARTAVDEARQAILAGEDARSKEEIALHATRIALQTARPSLRRVINASGVVIHTNLGRSVLSSRAASAVLDVAEGYSTLEYNTTEMARGSRHDHCERLLCVLTGAEAALAVNNNAAAVLLVLNELARGKEAVVSRGELVEIGGSFRIPDIMELSGATMVEAGTTNKTHPSDYQRAITDSTALLLKVHPSNYRMEGFTESVSVKQLRAIARTENEQRKKRVAACEGQTSHAEKRTDEEVLVYEDLGSGALVSLKRFGVNGEPTVAESLQAGCDVVSFSGDKLLGGPQAGIIVGRKDLIDRLKSNPLARALRLDKLTLAALEETLRIYLDPARALKEIPTLAMLTATQEDLRPQADKLALALKCRMPEADATVEVIEEVSRAGGGALPMHDIPTWAVRVCFSKGSALDCERSLIQHRKTPIIGRIKKEALLFDVRTLVDDTEIDAIVSAVNEYLIGVRQ